MHSSGVLYTRALPHGVGARQAGADTVCGSAINDFKENVGAKAEQDLGQASLEISEASGRAAGEHHLRESEVEENIEEGKKDTKGFL